MENDVLENYIIQIQSIRIYINLINCDIQFQVLNFSLSVVGMRNKYRLRVQFTYNVSTSTFLYYISFVLPLKSVSFYFMLLKY